MLTTHPDSSCQDCGKILDENDMAQGNMSIMWRDVDSRNNCFPERAVRTSTTDPGHYTASRTRARSPRRNRMSKSRLRMPLAGQDMVAYESGQPCIYCGIAKINQRLHPCQRLHLHLRNQTVPAVDPSTVVPSTNVATIHMMVNSGPLAKHNALLKLPIAQDLGRADIQISIARIVHRSW